MICEGSPHDTDEQLANTVGKSQWSGLGDAQSQGRLAPMLRSARSGEVRVKGPMVFRGYTSEAATAEAFDEDGWFRTGDVGHLRPDGHLVLTGRLKDIIIRKGENIAAKEIEDPSLRSPEGGRRCSNRPGGQGGARRACVRAVVTTAEGQDALAFDDGAAFKDAGLMRQKIPEQLRGHRRASPQPDPRQDPQVPAPVTPTPPSPGPEPRLSARGRGWGWGHLLVTGTTSCPEPPRASPRDRGWGHLLVTGTSSCPQPRLGLDRRAVSRR